ncbi:MAG TPA: DHHA1 domain-containing protein, partial [Mobilitalea sp.]|nr:DHHA1 domain-containing protein [Mobilitalea sp.]
MGTDETIYQHLDNSITSEFVGYDTLVHTSKITALTTENEIVNDLVAGQKGTIFVKETPFYATSGGQVADTGLITTETSEFVVEDTIKLQGGKIGHVGTVTKGIFKLNDTVTLKVNSDLRADTAKNHSATHLLHKALRMVLGTHVQQAGSLVSSDRLRFDFTHFSALTEEEISKVENIVNEQISNNLPVSTRVMSLDDAKKEGAMALFGEKYSEKVRVVSMGDFSKELCGGTHVSNTGSITIFKIISETGIAAGVRRIEALTGNGVIRYYKDLEMKLYEAAKTAKTEPAQLTGRIESLLEEIKALKSENEKLKSKLASSSIGDIMNQVQDVKGVKLLAADVPELDMNGLRNLGDKLRDKLGDGVIVLASSTAPDKVSLVVMVSDGAISKGAHAGNLIKELAVLVGGGGGRPNMAQAGGKNAAGIKDVIAKAGEVLSRQLG